MAGLKDLKRRIISIKGTRRITSAMKMMSAAKLRRAQVSAQEAKPYAERAVQLAQVLMRELRPPAPALFVGNREKGESEGYSTLIIAVASERGLCGGFNANVVKRVLERDRETKPPNRLAAMLIGRRARPALQRLLGNRLIFTHENVNHPMPHMAFADTLAHELVDMFERERFDRCLLISNRFVSALAQRVSLCPLIPIGDNAAPSAEAETEQVRPECQFEPERNALLRAIAPQIIAAQIFEAMLDSFAAEQAARMTAMDSATRNAGTLIDDLSLRYNRLRQSAITKELIEIISGAEAL